MRLGVHLLPVCALLLASHAAAGESACRDSVMARDYTRAISACLELPRQNRDATMNALANGNYVHYLGTGDRPSQAFAMLRTHAATGDVNAQYVFGTLYGMVHLRSPQNWRAGERGDDTRETYNARIRAESALWIKKAADQGHTLAMLDLADHYVQLSYDDPSVDLDSALAYANRAGENSPAIADPMVDKVKRRMRELR